MLVLGRERHEEIVITAGEYRIVVELVEAKRDWAKIGVSAPLGVTIHRGEIQRKIDAGCEQRGGGR